MSDPFFDHPILNSPYAQPGRHWELDPSGQPTQKIVEHRRRADFITPIPKPKKRKAAQPGLGLDDGKGLSTEKQQYDTTAMINEVRGEVEAWRALPNPNQWQVTPETARLQYRCAWTAALQGANRAGDARWIRPLSVTSCAMPQPLFRATNSAQCSSLLSGNRSSTPRRSRIGKDTGTLRASAARPDCARPSASCFGRSTSMSGRASPRATS